MSLAVALKDKTRAARAIGSELEVAVVKATNHDPVPPKRKHVEAILHDLKDPTVKLATVFEHLEERINSKSWPVALKALLVTHELVREPDQRVLRYVAQRPRLFNLRGFRDRCNVDSLSFVSLVEAYAEYMEERAIAYQVTQFDFVNEQLADAGRLRKTSDVSGLLRDTEQWQTLLAKLLNCKVDEVPGDNELIPELYRMLLKDAKRLHHAISKAVLHLVETFFGLQRSSATTVLKVYRRAMEETSLMNDFFKAGVKIGAVSESDVSALKALPKAMMETMEEHLRKPAAEGAKGRAHHDHDHDHDHDHSHNHADDEAGLPPIQRLVLDEPTSASHHHHQPARVQPVPSAVSSNASNAGGAVRQPAKEVDLLSFEDDLPLAAGPAAARAPPLTSTPFAVQAAMASTWSAPALGAASSVPPIAGGYSAGAAFPYAAAAGGAPGYGAMNFAGALYGAGPGGSVGAYSGANPYAYNPYGAVQPAFPASNVLSAGGTTLPPGLAPPARPPAADPFDPFAF